MRVFCRGGEAMSIRQTSAHDHRKNFEVITEWRKKKNKIKLKKTINRIKPKGFSKEVKP
tara:strand:+ start:518 stop:694 length:177 start_codon:yes stop_codon:yes gene_type:complete